MFTLGIKCSKFGQVRHSLDSAVLHVVASMSAEQVLEQIFEENEEESVEEVNIGERLKTGICSALKDGEVDKELFVSSCIHILEPLYDLWRIEVQEAYDRAARVLATHSVPASKILKDEASLWLNAILCWLVQKPGSQNAFHGQISRVWNAILDKNTLRLFM